MMETNSDHSIEFRRGDDFRRTVERKQVLGGLSRGLAHHPSYGLVYPTEFQGSKVELLYCGNCTRNFTRPEGSAIKYCGFCIAAMKA